jgi:hypothetical protein
MHKYQSKSDAYHPLPLTRDTLNPHSFSVFSDLIRRTPSSGVNGPCPDHDGRLSSEVMYNHFEITPVKKQEGNDISIRLKRE